MILKLTDSFKEELREKSDVEVKVSMLNINSVGGEKNWKNEVLDKTDNL